MLPSSQACPVCSFVRSKWSVNDVAAFIESIELSDHVVAFKEGSVDGAMFLQLTQEVWGLHRALKRHLAHRTAPVCPRRQAGGGRKAPGSARTLVLHIGHQGCHGRWAPHIWRPRSDLRLPDSTAGTKESAAAD